MTIYCGRLRTTSRAGGAAARPGRRTEFAGTAAVMRDVRAALLAGGRGERMGGPTDAECKPMVPYAGSRRLVDFSTANAMPSEVPEIAVMSQHLERDLIDQPLRRRGGRGGMHVHLGPYEAMFDGTDHSDGLPADVPLPLRPVRACAPLSGWCAADIYQNDAAAAATR